MSVAISVRNLFRYFGPLKAVDGVSFDIPHGSVCGFVGANGAGKTTTMRMLATLDYPTMGSAEVCGINVVNHPDKVRSLIGWMPDHFGNYEHMTVLEYLDFYARALGYTGDERRSRIEEVMAFADLVPLADRLSNKLSKGMTQRLCLGRALLHDPQVLIMDEPGTGLDPGARGDFGDYLAELRESDGTTVLLTTHFLEEAERCDRVAFLHRGEVVALGAPEELKGRVGGDVVAIHSGNPEGLGAKVRERFGCKAQVVRGVLRVERPEGHEFVREVVNAFPGDIRSVAFGKPTLGDVFVRLTGRGIDDGEAAENEGGTA